MITEATNQPFSLLTVFFTVFLNCFICKCCSRVFISLSKSVLHCIMLFLREDFRSSINNTFYSASGGLLCSRGHFCQKYWGKQKCLWFSISPTYCSKVCLTVLYISVSYNVFLPFAVLPLQSLSVTAATQLHCFCPVSHWMGVSLRWVIRRQLCCLLPLPVTPLVDSDCNYRLNNV